MNFFVFKKLEEDTILNDYDDAVKTKCTNKLVYDLLTFASEHHYYGNIWALYITYILVYDLNPLSLNSENHGTPSKGVKNLALLDMKYFFTLLNNPGITDQAFEQLFDLPDSKTNAMFNVRRVNKMIALSMDLLNAKNPVELLDHLISFYQQYGAGMYGFHKAYRLNTENGIEIIPIESIDNISFDDLVGYEWQKNKLINNTKNFVMGNKANNTLLYGDSGTGKSSSIKAVLNMFYPEGLRMIEVYKHQISYLAELISILKTRHYRFIIYMDDLSFDEFETEYKYLKSAIEGGLEVSPNNVLVYATSNRRYLVQESFKDNGGINDDLHREETKAEKLSLAARFGLSILYISPDNIEFKKIVKALAVKNNIELDDKELYSKANQWTLRYGNLSGRTATQFITYLMGGESEF